MPPPQACADLETAIVTLDIAAKSYKPPQLNLSAQGVASAAHTSGSHIPVGGSLQQTSISISSHFSPRARQWHSNATSKHKQCIFLINMQELPLLLIPVGAYDRHQSRDIFQ
ncbi:uncharacterized protein LOC115927242 [Strongylocentrotus purpuratus]|uniref:Uncharacterized protein n=1 Tax=Strongylocentrotus purpuratus TaxID=7668 RepID=A0A7M7PAZ4_STRPU|nr:uncharacterized protein LOC115927242 [Strongylocentrotus purpuratus]